MREMTLQTITKRVDHWPVQIHQLEALLGVEILPIDGIRSAIDFPRRFGGIGQRQGIQPRARVTRVGFREPGGHPLFRHG